jgi:hypothetical protein
LSAGNKRDSTRAETPAKRKTARWARKAVPAAAIAATLAAGTAAYEFTGTSHSDPGKVAAALAIPLRMSNMAPVGAGKAGVRPAASPPAWPAKVARAQAKAAPVAVAKPATAQVPSASAPKPTQPTQPTRPAQATQPTRPAQATQPAKTATASASADSVTTFTCSTASGMLPENVTAIVNFLIRSGYSHNAAAGIAGNMYQESKGDPESVGMGGGGLIGFTPLPAGYVTGNPSADLQRQLAAVLTYNQIWASYLPELNAAATPAAAAAIYVTDFERAGIPAASTREASAEAVASACGL